MSAELFREQARDAEREQRELLTRMRDDDAANEDFEGARELDAKLRDLSAEVSAEGHPTESDVIRAYALGHAHGQHRVIPETRDWAKARDWFRKLTFEEMRCSSNPDRDHEWVVALDGDGEPLDYLHCGYCGVRKPS